VSQVRHFCDRIAVSSFGYRKEFDDVSRKLDGVIEVIADGLCATGLQTRLDELEARKIALKRKGGRSADVSASTAPTHDKAFRWLGEPVEGTVSEVREVGWGTGVPAGIAAFSRTSRSSAISEPPRFRSDHRDAVQVERWVAPQAASSRRAAEPR
jgi:hypothetical protein